MLRIPKNYYTIESSLIEFTSTDLKWLLHWLPLSFEYYIFRFILYLCDKNIIGAWIKVTTPYGNYRYNNISNIPNHIINTDTNEIYVVSLKDLEVVWQIFPQNRKSMCV